MFGLDVVKGVSDTVDNILDKVIPDASQREAAKLEYARMKQDGEIKWEELQVRREENETDDRKDARKRQVDTKDNVPTYLATVTIIGFFATVGYVLSGKLNLSGEQGILIGTIIGYVSAKADQVLSYYFGSSSSSSRKDATIHSMIHK